MKKLLIIGLLLFTSTSKMFSPVLSIEAKQAVIEKYLQSEKIETITNGSQYYLYNNPFNIKYNSSNSWIGKIENKTNFENFESLDFGIRAGFKLLHNYQTVYNLTTINSIIHRFAPTSENNTEEYIKWMCKKTGFSKYQKINLKNKSTLILFCKYMIEMETGQIIEDSILEKVYTKYFT